MEHKGTDPFRFQEANDHVTCSTYFLDCWGVFVGLARFSRPLCLTSGDPRQFFFSEHPVDFSVQGHGKNQTLSFETNVDDFVEAGKNNAIRFEMDPETGEPSPYVHVRAGLEALIDRKSFYRLVELCEHETIGGVEWFGLYSSRLFFPIILSKELYEIN